jgi:hypothetical protein
MPASAPQTQQNWADFDLFAYARSKETAKETKQEADESVSRIIREQEVIDAARRINKPFTGFDLQSHLFETDAKSGKKKKWAITSVRPRLTELTQRCVLEVVGKVKTEHSKTRVCLYKLRDAQ